MILEMLLGMWVTFLIPILSKYLDDLLDIKAADKGAIPHDLN